MRALTLFPSPAVICRCRRRRVVAVNVLCRGDFKLGPSFGSRPTSVVVVSLRRRSCRLSGLVDRNRNRRLVLVFVLVLVVVVVVSSLGPFPLDRGI